MEGGGVRSSCCAWGRVQAPAGKEIGINVCLKNDINEPVRNLGPAAPAAFRESFKTLPAGIFCSIK